MSTGRRLDRIAAGLACPECAARERSALSPAEAQRELDSGGTWLPETTRRTTAKATVRILCPAEKAAPVEPTRLIETDEQRRIRQVEQATAGCA